MRAKAEPLKLAPMNIDAGEAPYFVDLVRDRLVQHLGDADFNHSGLRIYTSLDPDLQRVATEAVAQGMKGVDVQVEKLHARRVKAGDDSPIVYPQVALVALNPHTGQVLALVGGRNYGASQFDHAVATGRPDRSSSLLSTPRLSTPAWPAPYSPSRPGRRASDFPATGAWYPPILRRPIPAGRAASLPPSPCSTTISRPLRVVMPRATTITTQRYTGQITARTALQLSQNNATVSLAQMVGYNNVAALARDAGIKSARGTPAVALGAYGATPLEMAGAYTVFANGGVKIDPWLLASVRSANGDVLNDYPPNSKPILDPRVAYLTLALMENVINAGTAARVRVRTASPLLRPARPALRTMHGSPALPATCSAWCGSAMTTIRTSSWKAAKSAAPIWAEFMKHAVQVAGVFRYPPVPHSQRGLDGAVG